MNMNFKKIPNSCWYGQQENNRKEYNRHLPIYGSSSFQPLHSVNYKLLTKAFLSRNRRNAFGWSQNHEYSRRSFGRIPTGDAVDVISLAEIRQVQSLGIVILLSYPGLFCCLNSAFELNKWKNKRRTIGLHELIAFPVVCIKPIIVCITGCVIKKLSVNKYLLHFILTIFQPGAMVKESWVQIQRKILVLFTAISACIGQSAKQSVLKYLFLMQWQEVYNKRDLIIGNLDLIFT